MSTLRQRRSSPIDAKKEQQRNALSSSQSAPPPTTPTPPPPTTPSTTNTLPHPCTYQTAKWAILRLLGTVYFVAFLGAWYQNRGLLGSHGLQPAVHYMNRLRDANTGNSAWNGFLHHPTLFWWIDTRSDSFVSFDTAMDGMALCGCLLSLSVVLLSINSWFIMFLLWLLDFSIVTVAEGSSSFYSYGWESQLLETGFLAIFLCDLPYWQHGKLYCLWRDNASSSPPSLVILWLFTWLSFRISIGAGLIKIRGSSCWADKTCLHHHFETQPIPSPLSFVFHFLPKWLLSCAVDLDLWVQLYTSWFLLMPPTTTTVWWLKTIRRVGGFVQTGFMVNILLSGNFAILNHLTIVPSLACLDDDCWPRFWRIQSTPTPNIIMKTTTTTTKGTTTTRRPWRLFLIDLPLTVWIGHLSIPVVQNLMQWGGNRQQMNASYDPFRLVNTYGAFGTVGEARYEAILSVRFPSTTTTTTQDKNDWIELELPCKPGKVDRRPCFCAPYHYRMDWNIWFLGFPPHSTYLQRRETWMFALLVKLLQQEQEGHDDPLNDNDNQVQRPWLHLLDASSRELLVKKYQNGQGPVVAKVDMYRYRMKAPLWTLLWEAMPSMQTTITWWERTYKEPLIPPVQYDTTLQRLVRAE